MLVATPLGRQVSHGHSGKHSKTTKPRALSVEVIDFHVNSYLTGRRSPPQILTIPQASLSLPLPQAHGGMRCCERTCDPPCPLPPPRSQRLSLAAPGLPCPRGKQRAPCPPRATATGLWPLLRLPARLHRSSTTQRHGPRRADLHPRNRHCGASPEREPRSPQSHRAGRTARRGHRHPPPPRSRLPPLP